MLTWQKNIKKNIYISWFIIQNKFLKKSYNPKESLIILLCYFFINFFQKWHFQKKSNPLKTSLNIKNIDYIVVKLFLNFLNSKDWF